MAEADGSGRINLDWGGEPERLFRFTYGQARELQRLTGRGVREIIDRLLDGTYFVDEPLTVLRLGLIGAEVKPVEASALVKAHGEGRPLQESEYPALRVLFAFYEPAAGDALGKTRAERMKPVMTPRGASASPPSTGPVLQ